MTSTVYLPLIDGQTVHDVSDYSAYHQIVCPPTPGGGTLRIEYSPHGSDVWLLAQGGVRLDMQTGGMAVASGTVDRLRFTLTGSSGSGLTVPLVIIASDAWPHGSFPAGVWSGDAAITASSYREASIRRGDQFEVEAEKLAVAANGGTFDVVFVSGADPVTFDQRVVQFTGQKLAAVAYRDVQFTGGTAGTLYNPNDIAGIDPLTTGCAVWVNPTINNLGARYGARTVAYGAAGQGNRTTGTFVGSGSQRIIKPNTAYLLRMQNLDPSAVADIHLFWSIHVGRLDLP